MSCYMVFQPSPVPADAQSSIFEGLVTVTSWRHQAFTYAAPQSTRCIQCNLVRMHHPQGIIVLICASGGIGEG